VAGWVEMLMLRSTLNARIGHTGLPARYVAELWTSAGAGSLVGWLIKLALPPMHPIAVAVVVLGAYGLVFLGATIVLRVPEARALLARVRFIWQA